MAQRSPATTILYLGGHAVAIELKAFALEIEAGPDAGKTLAGRKRSMLLGTHPSSDLVLTDPHVSRLHARIDVEEQEVVLSDLGSTNGTRVSGIRVRQVCLEDGAVVELGETRLRFRTLAEPIRIELAEGESFEGLIGRSTPMRELFALSARVAPTDATVLLQGETGSGKELVARAIHERSLRRGRPFVVFDCGAVPPTLIESELFGHEKGAFTGAVAARAGAFEAAHGGTIFLDEIGDLPLDMQPRLLRAIEHRQIRRVGGNGYRPIDVRVIAATNRDLRGLVNERDFRGDLYYRLAVLRVRLPPLRERPEDLAIIVARLLERLGASGDMATGLFEPSSMARIQRAAWPGNVRELRNYLERCLVLRETLLPLDADPAARGEGPIFDPRVSYEESRRRAIATWERRYLEMLLAAHGGHVEQAGRASGMARAHLYRLVAKHGLLNRHRR